MKKIKVVQILPYFPPHIGGLEMVAKNISKYLVSHTDTDVINITSDIGQKKKGYHCYKEDKYEVICLPSFNIVNHFPCYKFWHKSFWQVFRKIKRYKPDIIQTHTRFFLQTFLGGILAKYLGIKWVHVEHGSGFVKGISRLEKNIARIYDQILGRLVFILCDRVISINKANISFISKFIKKEKIQIIYNGIDMHEYNQRKENIGFVQFTFIGRLSPLKGVDILIDSCNELIKKNINNRKLNIVGDGEMKNNLLYLIEKNGLGQYISLLGTKNHNDIMSEILPYTDILVNPSHQEGLPTSVLEGLLYKCVVVATDVGGTKEISDKPDLILVKNLNKLDLSIALEYAINNRKSLSGISHKYIIENFNWNKSSQEYYDIFSNLYKKST